MSNLPSGIIGSGRIITMLDLAEKGLYKSALEDALSLLIDVSRGYVIPNYTTPNLKDAYSDLQVEKYNLGEAVAVAFTRFFDATVGPDACQKINKNYQFRSVCMDPKQIEQLQAANISEEEMLIHASLRFVKIPESQT